MTVIVQVGQFLAETFTKLWTAFGTWGVIGFGIIALAVVSRIANLLKKIFQF